MVRLAHLQCIDHAVDGHGAAVVSVEGVKGAARKRKPPLLLKALHVAPVDLARNDGRAAQARRVAADAVAQPVQLSLLHVV